MSADIIEHPSGRRRPSEDASKRWWRPHDIPAWAVLTAAMETEAIGALGLLFDYCYMHGRLPNSDPERARICKLSGKKYARHRAQLMAHFDAEGRNQEIEATREHSKRISAVKSEAGRKGGVSKSQAYARQEPEQNASYLHQHQQPHKDSQEQRDLQSTSTTPPSPPPDYSVPRAREGNQVVRVDQLENPTGDKIAAELLATLPLSGRAHPGWRGFGTWIDRLLTDGVDRVDIAVGVFQCLRSLQDRPPTTFNYFSAAIERAREARTRPLPSTESDPGFAVLQPGTQEWQAEHDRLLSSGANSKAALMAEQAERGHGWTVQR